MKQTAQGLAALGRGPDTQLVHMAPGEVQSLQRLAQAHGGSLTINPATGLPEAGFLSSILPMVIGAGLMAATGGTAAPLIAGMSNAATIGLGVGGLQALRTGSLSKGLMAGLGAYGGAGLAGGLMGVGTGAISSAAGAGVEIPAGAIVPEVAASAPTSAIPAYDGAGMASFGEQTAMNNALAAQPVPYYGPSAGAEAATVGLPQTVTQAPVIAAPAAPAAAPQLDFANAYSQDQAMQKAVADKLATSGPLDRIGAGLQSATASPGAAFDFAKANKMPLGAIGLSALLGSESEGGVAPAQSQGLIRPYTYSREKIPGSFQDVAGAPMSSRERRYFTDQYTAGTPYKAPGPEYMANGGVVEAMSNANALGENTGYPQAGISTGAYSTPLQRPIGQNVVTGAQDAAVDPYTGQATFADGGAVGGYMYDPVSRTYSKAGGQSITAVKPAGFDSQAQGSGGMDGKMSAAQQAFFDTETPAERDARMAQINDFLAAVVPGASMARGASDFANSVANANAMASMQAAQQADVAAAGGEGIGGGDISGQSEGTPALARGGMAHYATGGISDLGSYSDGGRLLRGPGDGVSDSIPAVIGKKRPARLADGEFVVPARIVSELGNGSTEAGARKLYAMMERVQRSRSKTVGKGKVAVNNKSFKHLPA